jgi:hypothetical protein
LVMWKYRSQALASELRPGRPPASRLVKITGELAPASSQMCMAMSDEERIKCLCPRPLLYTLTRIASPSNNNYSTILDLKTPREPMYRARIFARCAIDEISSFHASPNEGQNAAIGVVQMDYDKYSIILKSTAPQTSFRAVINSSEGLRLICANQDN